MEFDYEDGIPLLRDINLRIAKGEVVAIVGTSGAGKTTLASLIPRFFDVTSGSITLDGHDVRDVKTQFAARPDRHRHPGDDSL